MKLVNNRVSILLCGIIVLLVMGLIYAWSIFVLPLEDEYGWSRSQTSMTFSISMAMWAFGTLASGQLSKRVSQRLSFSIGAGCIALGFFLCRFISGLSDLYFFYGVFCGFGCGLCYNLWISSVLEHFPDKVGFASGCLLMGFGMGSMVLGSGVAAMIYSPLGWRSSFTVLAIIIIFVALLSLPFLHHPDTSARVRTNKPSINETGLELSGSEILKEPSFWAFTVWKVLAMGAAAAIIAQASVVMTGIGASTVFATVTVGMLSIGNGCGRPLFGIVYDKIGQGRSLILLSASGIVIGVGMFVANSFGACVAMAVLLFFEGVMYGGYAAINTSFSRSTYGQKSLSMNLGISSFTLMPFNFFMPILCASIFDSTGSYSGFFLLVPFIALISLVAGIVTNRAIPRMCKRHGPTR